MTTQEPWDLGTLGFRSLAKQFGVETRAHRYPSVWIEDHLARVRSQALDGQPKESKLNKRHLVSWLSRMRLGEFVEASMEAMVSRTVLAFWRISSRGKSGSSFSK